MVRAPWLRMWVTAGVMIAGGCTKEGGVELSWEFHALPDGSGEVEPASAGCGRHGVASLFVTGANDAGDGTSFIAVCTAGATTRTVPVGEWTFALHTLDVQGRVIGQLDPPDAVLGPLAVDDGGSTVFPRATITPRAACADGVDNDGDGSVDLADLDCADATDVDESAARQP